MQDIETFLAHAIRLEEEAANRFSDLTALMKTYGNEEVAAFFNTMAGFSRQHLAQARARSGFHPMAAVPADAVSWPAGESPEATSMEASHYLMTVEYALELALEGEKRSLAFYQEVAESTEDPEVRLMAQEFVEEEADHVRQLEAWVARYPSPKAPSPA